jgi:hypothetical protein
MKDRLNESEPGAVAIGQEVDRETVNGYYASQTKLRLDPVATTRGSDTRFTSRPQFRQSRKVNQKGPGLAYCNSLRSP